MKPSNMKKSNLKTPRRKVIPHRYLKKSNTSLSQLLNAASYKKIIKDLKRNNQALAVALQASRSEVAAQANLLKDYSRDSNYIMFARLKLKDVVKAFSKLVTDIDEVMNYLDVGWASNNIQFTHKDRSPTNEKLKMKAPSVSIIEEVSSMSEQETSKDLTPKLSSSSHELMHEDDVDNENLHCSVLDIPSVDEDVNSVPPLLFVDETEGCIVKEKSSGKAKSSKRQSSLIQQSLTPTLDIDISVRHKRSSSLFDCADYRKTRSGKKNSGSQDIISSPVIDVDESNVIASKGQQKKNLKSQKKSSNKKRKKSSPVQECSKGLSPVVDMNTAVIHSPAKTLSNINTSNELIIAPVFTIPPDVSKSSETSSSVKNDSALISQPALSDTGSSSIKDLPCATPKTGVTSLQIANKTLLLCEDMELTDVVPIFNLTSTISNVTVPDVSSNQDLKKNNSSPSNENNVPSQTFKDSNEELCERDQNISGTETTEIYDVNICTNNPVQKMASVMTENDNQKLDVSKVSSLQNQSLSPFADHVARKRKPPMCLVFSSDESDSDYTPYKNVAGKKKDRVTAVFKPKSSLSRNASKSPGIDLMKQKKSMSATDTSLSRPSVFDFNVSNTETPNKVGKKKKVSVTRRKTCKNKDSVSKPISKKCTVTKLKGFCYKFSKEKLENDNNKVNSDTKLKQDLVPVDNLALSKPVTNTVNNSISNETPDLIYNKIECSEELNLSTVCLTPNADAKRVSFAATDLVCNFKRMSQSKTISVNKKVPKTSKCLSELEKELSFEELNNSKHDLRLNQVTTDEENSLFDFSGETELYTMKLTSLMCPLPKPLKLQSQEVFSVVEKKDSADSFIKHHGTDEDTNHEVNFKKNKPSLLKSSVRKKANAKNNLENAESSPNRITADQEHLKENCIINNSQASCSLDTKKLKSENSVPEIYSKQNSKNVLINLGTNQCSIISNGAEKQNIIDKCKLSSKLSVKGKKKSVIGYKSAESSPVLRDVLNLGHQSSNVPKAVSDGAVLSRRRSKPISYKEPALNKKMRR